MDPNEAFALMILAESRGDELAATGHAVDLAEWLAAGGFAPGWDRHGRATFARILNRAWDAVDDRGPRLPTTGGE